MYKRVLETIHAHDLLPVGSRIVIGVSGGADSMALLHILHKLSTKRRYKLFVAHVYYGIRGDDARRDRDLVQSTARTYNIPFYEKNLSLKPHPIDEAWLRDARYTFFEEVRTQCQATAIAVAHTRNDSVETLLLNLLRGSGLSGLTGISYKRDAIIRPLLDCSRDDIEDYCLQHHILYHIDSTNTDTVYVRNRIRHNLIPHLRKEYSQNILKTLSRTARTIADDYTELLSHAHNHLPPYTRSDDTISFSAEDFCALSASLQRITLRFFAYELHHHTPSFGMVEEWRKLIASHKNKSHQMRSSALIVTKNGATVSMTACP